MPTTVGCGCFCRRATTSLTLVGKEPASEMVYAYKDMGCIEISVSGDSYLLHVGILDRGDHASTLSVITGCSIDLFTVTGAKSQIISLPSASTNQKQRIVCFGSVFLNSDAHFKNVA